MKHIETLCQGGGEVSIGPCDEFTCLGTAANDHGTVAIPIRREGETLAALLRRLVRAVGRYHDSDMITDDICDDCFG